jgi:hypothetical protein
MTTEEWARSHLPFLSAAWREDEHCGGRAARAELVSGTEAASKGLLLLGWAIGMGG